ncbi:MAG: methyltransferase domain-containing protein [Flavobacterium sp.]|nr:methyltransferase domain-containing protein [Flavobacterium sp.]
MLPNTTYRTTQVELMDDFAMEGEILRDALDKIAKINRFLGGNKLTLQGVKQLLKLADTTKEITIVDIGCGNGDMLRFLADYATAEKLNLKLIGIDANDFTIAYAEKISAAYHQISYRREDIFNESFKELKYDIVLCTLTLHHFKNDQILQLLKIFERNSAIGIVINDLQRSAISYQLFQLLCAVFALNKMSREDGLVSILRGFKKEELIAFSKQLNLKKYSIRWKWAFRYQWIIPTI